jgi:hypothetical protein
MAGEISAAYLQLPGNSQDVELEPVLLLMASGSMGRNPGLVAAGEM